MALERSVPRGARARPSRSSPGSTFRTARSGMAASSAFYGRTTSPDWCSARNWPCGSVLGRDTPRCCGCCSDSSGTICVAGQWRIPTVSAAVKARHRLGREPFKALFRPRLPSGGQHPYRTDGPPPGSRLRTAPGSVRVGSRGTNPHRDGHVAIPVRPVLAPGSAHYFPALAAVRPGPA